MIQPHRRAPVSKSLFTFGFNPRPEWSDRKWTDVNAVQKMKIEYHNNSDKSDHRH